MLIGRNPFPNKNKRLNSVNIARNSIEMTRCYLIYMNPALHT